MGEHIRSADEDARGTGPRFEPQSPASASPNDHCPIVGIGASAGGLEVFSRILRALPDRIGMALVLVQHLDPTHESMLADLLHRHSKMPVVDVEDGQPLESDHVYVMPAGVSMVVYGGVAGLSRRPKSTTRVLPIDTLFRSLAKSCGGRAIGVVLSGTGSDGALGLSAIKEAGGLTFAQDPESAEYEGMPRAAIDVGAVDAVLDPEHIAAELVRIGRHSGTVSQHERTETEAPRDADEGSLNEILSLLLKATGLDLTQYRRTTLLRRVSRRMLLQGVPTMKEYLQRLQERPGEVGSLYRDILVNMTQFFRDPDALDALKRDVFPTVLAEKGPEDAIRIWIPGCSKGQEAYSILISLVEFLEKQAQHRTIQMFASDVNEQDVDFARAGVYPEGISNEVSAERLERFFVQVPGGYQIDRSIRELCVFAVHDVTKDPPFSKLDIVSFRNVLIYMEKPLQNRVLQVLHYALAQGGFLLLGSSETTGTESALFSLVDKRHRIYKRKPGVGRMLPALSPSAGTMGFARRDQASGRPAIFDPLSEADKVVQGSYQPSGILVTADLDVLQFRGHVGRYLDPIEGPPALKLPRLLAPGLSASVEAAVREAARTKMVATRSATASGLSGGNRGVDVEVVPIPAPTGESYYLVLFKEKPRKPAKPAQKGRPDEAHAAAEDAGLRRELDETREQLDALVSEREAANTDLRTAKEQFQSSSEELRTINEEFQTAQEELQSTNEELTTLNDELRNRNMELGLLADDLNNVIEGVEIPILILDRGLRIRRFTPEARAIVNIVPADVGRPVTDLSLNVGAPDFKALVQGVLRSGSPCQSEVRSTDGRWFSMRIRPYRAGDGSIEGAVVAFIDIDDMKRNAEVTEAARAHAQAVVESVREPLLTLGSDLQVREANDAFYRTFAVSAKETIGKPLYGLGDGQWDFDELRSLLKDVLPGDKEFANLVVEREFPRVGHRVMELYARRVREEQEQPSILLAMNDITEAAHRARLSMVLNNVSLPLGSTLEFDRVMEQVLDDTAEALRADSAVVVVKQDGAWIVRNAHGLPRTLVGRAVDERILPPLERGSGVPVLVGHSAAGRLIAGLGIDSEVGSTLVIPLLLREETVGIVSLQYASAEVRLSDAESDFVNRLGTLLSLASENARLYATQREIAETLQGALLTVPAKIPGVDFGYLYRSASKSAAVGGDFFDLFELGEGRVGVLLGDVSGKGVQAATLTALVKNTVRALAYENDSPAAVVAKTNAVIFKATPSSLFVTLIFGILETASGRLVYCSAGHTRGIIKKAAGDAVELLMFGSPLAGAFEEATFADGAATLEQGDVLVLYTDGVTEARQGSELYGEERLVQFIGELPKRRPREIADAVFAEVQRYTGGTLSDDVAIMAVTPKRQD